jgi:hypothetical protein
VSTADAAAAPVAERAPDATVAHGVERTVALGWIAVLPLVVAYEIALSRSPGSPRNTAEYLLSLPFEALLARPAVGRIALEAVATGLAAWALFQAELGLVRRVLRVVLEGLVAAVALGPLLLVLLHLMAVAPPSIGLPAAVPGPTSVALLIGGAAFEELVFRLALLAAIYLVARSTAEWFLGLPRASRVIAEIAALSGSAVVFAAAHLDVVVGLIAPGGEPYDGARFAWRVSAGLALALLFRFRGMGVAAWCHALFNLALALGAGPGVFL